MAAKAFIFRFADVEVYEREFSLVKARQTISVEPKAFRVLLLLLRNPKKLITKEELLDTIWGDAAVTENSLARSIALLRRLLDDDARNPRFIETVATVGYRWLCPVEQREDHTAISELGEAVSTGPELATAAAPAGSGPGGVRRRRVWWLAAGAGAAAILLLAGAMWYLSRPLPPLRITAYTQITHDGRNKELSGTDGSRLYFTQKSPEAILQVGVNGGEAAQVLLAVPGTGKLLLGVSADGSNALVETNEKGHVSDPPIWLAPLLGGPARRLGDGSDEAFSPDGSSVIYWTLEGAIYSARIDGTEKQKLAFIRSQAASFSWSPDGKAIRFTDDGMLWEMSSDGSGLHRLLPDWKEPGIVRSGKWTPNGHFYLFDLDSPSAGRQIWALDERRRLFSTRSLEPVRLTTGPVRWGQLVPDRNGTRIFAEGITPRGELSLLDPRTGALQPMLGGISAEDVSFSPNQKWVAYVSFPDGMLWKADRDGANHVQLADGPDHILNPRWSPDSKQILFTATTPDRLHPSIYVVSVDGGKPQRLLATDNADMHDANWSPDGRKILFARGVYITHEKDLRILDLDSGHVNVIPGSFNMWSPRWSPDGRHVLAMFSDARVGLPILDLKTQKWSTLPVTGEIEFPSFSRNSRSIYFLRGGRDQEVIRVPVTGGKEERVADMTQWHITGFLGYSMTLDPTDNPLVLRDVGSDDIYALTLEEK
jgi:Tol biopolymer transport system component/DNA-binding winged helix-turn-helix (wHTH) protein